MNRHLMTVATVAAVAAMLCLSGCGDGRGIIYCEGARTKSPDGECSAQLVQDVTSNSAYAVVECNDWHYEPYPDWKAVVLDGAYNPLAARWIRNQVLEVTVPSGITVKQHQPIIRGRSYAVEVLLRSVPNGSQPLLGCGLTR